MPGEFYFQTPLISGGITERLHGMRFDTRRLAKDEVIDWITFYNHRRLHSTLGYASPMAFERKWLASQISLAA
jgi:transposase InsO family protein